jgi:hypothetical protein
MPRPRRRALLCAAALLAACSGEADTPVLQRVAEGLGATVTRLPEFRVYDHSGALVLHQYGFEEAAFAASLQDALADPQPVAGAPPLDELVGSFASVSGCGEVHPFELGSRDGVDFFFVEYWADWCAPCREQLAYVDHFLRAQPAPERIAWVKVERRTSTDQRAVRVR